MMILGYARRVAANRIHALEEVDEPVPVAASPIDLQHAELRRSGEQEEEEKEEEEETMNWLGNESSDCDLRLRCFVLVFFCLSIALKSRCLFRKLEK